MGRRKPGTAPLGRTNQHDALGEWDHRRMPVAQGRVALVTGSSRGLGAVIARRLARDGLAVAVNSLHGDGQADEVGRSYPGRWRYRGCLLR